MSRFDRFQSAVDGSDLDAVVLNPGATMSYLTSHDFTSHERLFLLLVRKSGAPIAIVPLLEDANFRHAVPEAEHVFLWDDADGPGDAVRQAFAELGDVARIGVESLSCRFMELSWIQRGARNADVVAADSIGESLRLIKDADEIANLRGAAEIAEAALERVLQDVRVGASERQITGHLSSELLRRGGEGISFGPIVLAGAKSALPHGVPDERELAAGDFLLIDFGTSHKGYHCDITRTFVVGAKPSDRQREVYEAVREANRAGIAATRAGVTCDEVHHTCQAGLMKDTFADFLKHRTGHGLGSEIHEPPSIMSGNTERLEAGTVFTIEPGLYLDGWGGVRIEDDVVVTADGCDVLTSFPKDLRVLGL